jgi:hypothetical protein
MIQPLDKHDVAPLAPIQKAAILESLYMVIAIDRQIEPAEQQRFEVEVRRIPWGLDEDMLTLICEKARLRVKSTLQREAWMAWIKEIALLLPNLTLREKVIRTMGEIAIDVNSHADQSVRGLINEFGNAFSLTANSLIALQAEFKQMQR